jgi:hypothetical protein
MSEQMGSIPDDLKEDFGKLIEFARDDIQKNSNRAGEQARSILLNNGAIRNCFFP